MTGASHFCAVDCARLAAERIASTTNHRFGRGGTGLRAVARTAPLLGAFGSTALLLGALRSYLRASWDLCDCADGTAEALVPMALSLPVAIFAEVAFRLVRRQVETLNLEMSTAVLDLVSALARRPHRG